jgi:Tfp pilus assembly protein PilN
MSAPWYPVFGQQPYATTMPNDMLCVQLQHTLYTTTAQLQHTHARADALQIRFSQCSAALAHSQQRAIEAEASFANAQNVINVMQQQINQMNPPHTAAAAATGMDDPLMKVTTKAYTELVRDYNALRHEMESNAELQHAQAALEQQRELADAAQQAADAAAETAQRQQVCQLAYMHVLLFWSLI